MVPIAEKAVPMTPRMVLMRFWKRPMMEPRAAVMVLKIPAMRFSREVITEGMIADFSLSFL